jgi:hypothetical protein
MRFPPSASNALKICGCQFSPSLGRAFHPVAGVKGFYREKKLAGNCALSVRIII